jgi:hypothetical protein
MPNEPPVTRTTQPWKRPIGRESHGTIKASSAAATLPVASGHTACDPSSAQFDPRYRALARRPRREEVLEAYDIGRQLGQRLEDVTFEKARDALPAWARAK